MKKMKMPWLAMRHSMGDANKMMKEFGSSGIPTLIIIDEEGKMVLDEAGKPIGNARQDIFKGPNAAWKRWTK